MTPPVVRPRCTVTFRFGRAESDTEQEREAALGRARARGHLRAGRVELARSTVCGWHAELAALARPLVDAMRPDALAQVPGGA